MNRRPLRLALSFVFVIALRCSVWAHIGSPSVFFDGQAGPYPVHVVILPPEVIPGLAEISVRVEAGGIERVTALPMKWNTGRKGAPPPDVARLVRGETNLYSAQLWFMEGGAQSVEIELFGSSGRGRATVPVDAVARRVLTMPKNLGGILSALGLLLFALLVSLVGAAVRESVLEPGAATSTKRRWGARGAMAGGGALLILLLWGGRKWWESEAADYRNNRLTQPTSASARVNNENGRRRLRLEIDDPKFARSSPLVPDHGKLMHLFLVREPRLDAFAHLHPLKRDRKTFETLLPDLPEGSYRLYADVTHETGASETITTAVDVPPQTGVGATEGNSTLQDADDSWRMSSPPEASRGNRESRLSDDYTMSWSAPARLELNSPVRLDFTVRNTNGESVKLEPYLGMRGHLALRREDGAVFTHLHPGGSASMAAMQLSVLRSEGKLPFKAAFGAEDPICELPAAAPGEEDWLRGNASTDSSRVSFPYAFPKTGHYRLWVQVKINGEVRTGIFDVEVQPFAKT
jgi:hypothetical protein